MHAKAGYPAVSKQERLFFPAETMADEIIRVMDSGRPRGTVLLGAGLRRLVGGSSR